MFIELLLKNWKLIVAGLFIAALIAAGVYIKILKSDISTLDAEKQTMTAELEVSQASIKSLQISITEQNTAIDKMKSAADLREQSHATELAKAKLDSVSAKKRADELMKSQAPQNLNKCDAADALINMEIKNAK